MLTIRKANDRGHANHGWLDSYHTFSFAGYRDPNHMGFRSLRVINEDRVEPGQGFGTHGHESMEIISYVLDGTLAHKDSEGHEGVITPGEFQYMSAGSGIRHSEFNGSDEKPVHFLQIWIIPDAQGGTPRYAQVDIPVEEKQGAFTLVAARPGQGARFDIGQDAKLSVGRPSGEDALTYELEDGRHAWVQVTSGSVAVNGTTLEQGDAVAISEESVVTVSGPADSEVLLFDLA